MAGCEFGQAEEPTITWTGGAYIASGLFFLFRQESYKMAGQRPSLSRYRLIDYGRFDADAKRAG
jgi:hypothetical protein